MKLKINQNIIPFWLLRSLKQFRKSATSKCQGTTHRNQFLCGVTHWAIHTVSQCEHLLIDSGFFQNFNWLYCRNDKACFWKINIKIIQHNFYIYYYLLWHLIAYAPQLIQHFETGKTHNILIFSTTLFNQRIIKKKKRYVFICFRFKLTLFNIHKIPALLQHEIKRTNQT